MLDSGALREDSPIRNGPAKALPAAVPALVLILIVVAAIHYICFFSHLDALGLVGPDEPRYADVARAMAESGDWVTPRLNGQPWFEKPALYYWSAALAFRALGANEFAARLPSALAATLAALALACAAWRSYGFTTTLAVLLVFPTCVGVFAFARAATPDMLFSAALTAAMVVACPVMVRARESEQAGAATQIAFGAFLGAATLAKGPAAIALAAGSVGLWALSTKRWRRALGLAHPAAVLAFCATALPWYILCAARNPDFIRIFLFEHNFERYLTPLFHHGQPFWFFGPVLLLGLLPWTVLLAGAAREAALLWQEKQWANSPSFFFFCWALFPVVFFSFSKSKLPGYVLPAMPPLALLLARSAVRGAEEKDLFARALFTGIGATLVALGASGTYRLWRLLPDSDLAGPHMALPWAVLAATGGLAVAFLGGARRPTTALLATAVLMAGLIEGVNQRVVPLLDAYLSPRVAARAAQTLAPGENVSVYRLQRAWRYGLNFYLHRELHEWSQQAARPGWVYTSAAGFADLERQGVRGVSVERSSPRAWLARVP